MMRQIIFLIMLILLSACDSTYYRAWQSVGVDKKELLLRDLRNCVEKENSYLALYAGVANRIGKTYDIPEPEAKGKRAQDFLREDQALLRRKQEQWNLRVKQIKKRATDLFAEWQANIETTQSESLREKNTQGWQGWRKDFEQFNQDSEIVENNFISLLKNYRDMDLYLVHNREARTLGKVAAEFKTMALNMSLLNKSLADAMKTANEFLIKYEEPK